MTASRPFSLIGDDTFDHDTLFEHIARELMAQGYSIRPMGLPDQLQTKLFQHQRSIEATQFSQAGIGRAKNYLQNSFVRSNEICWINGSTEAGRDWLAWTHALQTFLNHRLFLGLFSFESHFAHYGPGDFYKRHYDAFKGSSNRKLSIVTYLNPNWAIDDGGELVLYRDDNDIKGIRIIPLLGTLVIFLSEEFPHEVLPANRDRYSIAGWFRVNTSTSNQVDPPF